MTEPLDIHQHVKRFSENLTARSGAPVAFVVEAPSHSHAPLERHVARGFSFTDR